MSLLHNNSVKETWKIWLIQDMGRVKRISYLSPMRAAKVQASLRIRTVSPEPPLLAHTSSESKGTSVRKPDPWPLWMAGHARLKFVMMECSKTQIRLTGLTRYTGMWENMFSRRSILQVSGFRKSKKLKQELFFCQCFASKMLEKLLC